MKSQTRLKVGIIGLGAIGGHVANCIEKGEAGNAELVALVCRDKEKYLTINKDQSSRFKSLITDDIETLFAAKPDIVIEAAGQESLSQYGITILEKGIDLLVSSIGLFTNDDILAAFTQTAEQSGAQMLLSAGALPALDWMSASSLSEVSNAMITQEKPVISWKGTRAEELIDLDSITKPTCFFEGTAREAANIFPKSSNISAMLALATVGLDNTKVRLVADPISPIMNTLIEFDSEVGQLQLNCQGIPSPENPSTSTGVPLSIVKSIRNLSSSIHYGI
ncbi:aspartate dehydrogenase [Marinomonas sp. 5E14-1]|uniref:aspartate dehydrogenase n=1 Tax=Marinomonas sp. 5E14-1 TaxID=3153922 RepID=UPI00326581DC